MKLHFAQPQRQSLVVFALAGLAVLTFVLGCLVSYQKVRDERQGQQREEAQRLLLAFEAHSIRMFDYADGHLRAIRAYVAEHGNVDTLDHFVREIQAPHAELFSGIVTTMDREGWVTYQSETPRHKLRDFGKMSGLDHFQYFVQHPGDSIFVGGTRLGKFTGKRQFRMARPLFKDGVFDGLVVLTLLPEHITDFYRSVSLAPHSTVTMLTRERRLIARQPLPATELYDRVIADSAASSAMDRDSNSSGSAFGVFSPFDNIRRDVFYKQLADYPVRLVVGISEQDLDDFMAGLRRSLTLLVLGFCAAVAIVSALALRMLKQNRLVASAALRLQASEARLIEAQRIARIGSWTLDLQDGKLSWSDEIFRLFEIAPSQFGATYGAFLNAIHPEDRAAVDAAYQRSLGDRAPYEITHRLLMSDGRVKWVQERCTTVFDADGKPLRSSGTVQDITERKLADEGLRIAAVAFESQEGLVVTDANSVILSVNRAFTQATGYTPAEIVGKTPRLLKSGRHDDSFYREMWQSLNRDGEWKGEIWDRRKNGEIYPKSLSISAVKGEDGSVTHYVASQHDITERKRAEERIKELAYFDPLTGLPNRVTLHEKLTQVLRLAERNESRFALMLIDLDNFKAVNDTLGHLTGDELLITVAERLGSSVRQSDLVARLGGDEFVIVLPEVDGPTDVAHVAEKILAAIAQPYLVAGRELHTSPSIGICLYPDDASDGEDMIKKADVAMYHAKSCGRGNYQFFRENIQAAAVQRLAIEADLRVALAKQQFVLHYQPQLDLRSGRLVGVEALIRWQHPQRGMVAPLDFIPIAEESGLILPIGAWVLEESCRQLAQWRGRGLEQIKMSVNLAASQFADHDLPAQILAILDQTGVPACSLELEVTESMTMKSPAGTAVMMEVLTGHELSLSIDDFGTGYSSLAYLKLFPISTLKIDRSFVKDIETDQNDADICDVTVLLAHKLGLSVVAEGVETEAQLKYLLSIGCEKVQGYLISKPLPAAEAEAFIREHPVMAGIGTVELWQAAAASA